MGAGGTRVRRGARRGRATVGVALAASLVTAFLHAPPAGAETGASIVAVINTERQANGLPLVREDPALSAGCAQYDNYRRLNGSLGDAFTLHGETPGGPGYTQAGAQAARHSLLNAGDRAADSFASGDVFDSAPNHLVALMDPSVAVVGADQTDFPFGLFGTVHLVCIDVRSAPSRPKPRRVQIYLYRGPRGYAPRRHVAYREGPPGLGAVVALYIDAPRGARVKLRSLKLLGPAGATKGPAGLTLSGGLTYAPRHARAALSKGAAKSSLPTAVFRAGWSLEESIEEAENRERHEQAVAEREQAEREERERHEQIDRQRFEEDERGERSDERVRQEEEESERSHREDQEVARFEFELSLPPGTPPLPEPGVRTLFE